MLKQSRSKLFIALLGLSALSPIHLANAQDQAPDNDFWWPNRLSLEPLRQNAAASDPLAGQFDYAEAYASLDMEALRRIVGL